MPDSPSPDILDHIASTQAIQRLCAEYCHGADKRQLDRFLAVWHPDAVWDVGTFRFTGHDEIADAVTRQWQLLPQMHHWTSNTSVTLDGELATAESDVSTMTQLDDGSWLLSGGTYLDAYARRAGEWRLTRRSARVHVSMPVGPPSAEGKGFEPLSAGTPH